MVIEKYSVWISQTPGKAAGCGYIAESTTLALRIRNDDITGFFGFVVLPTCWKICRKKKPEILGIISSNYKYYNDNLRYNLWYNQTDFILNFIIKISIHSSPVADKLQPRIPQKF